jgi:Tfp pilus assembly protein PilO
MNLNKRQQLLAIVAIAAVGLFMADKIIITPLTKSWDARSKRIAKLKEDVRTGDDLLKREKSWRDQWTQMHANLLSTDKAVAESQMMKAFERWSRDGGVSVSSIRPQWKEAEDNYKTLECRADVAGNMPSIAHFLYQLERDPLGVKVDSMEMTSRNTEGSQIALIIQVSGLLINEKPKPKS